MSTIVLVVPSKPYDPVENLAGSLSNGLQVRTLSGQMITIKAVVMLNAYWATVAKERRA